MHFYVWSLKYYNNHYKLKKLQFGVYEKVIKYIGLTPIIENMELIKLWKIKILREKYLNVEIRKILLN